MKKILIIGASGFIGKNLVEYYSKFFNVIKHKKTDNLITSLKSDPDVIINCGAEIYLEENMFDSNVKMVYDLIKYVKKRNIKLIHIGSSAEYGEKKYPSKEKDFLDPRNPYEATKAASSLMCLGYAREYNLPIIVARPYSVYGNYEKNHRLFPKLFDAFYNDVHMTLNQGFHDFIYIKDFIRGIDILLNNDIYGGDIVNFGSGKQYSNFEVYKIFKQITKKQGNVSLNDEMVKAFESDVWICDINYADKKYNFKTHFSLEDGIKDFIQIKKETICQTQEL